MVLPAGVTIVDNVLARGEILEALPETAGYIEAVRAFNAAASGDTRVHSMILSIADGILMAVKK